MLTVDIKELLRRLNKFCTRCLEGAAGLCVSRAHYEVSVEHFLLKLLEEPNADIQLVLRHFEIDPGRLGAALQRTIEEFKSGNPGKPVFSPSLLEWIQESWLVGSVDLNLPKIRSGVLFLVLLSNPSRFTWGKYVDTLTNIRVEEFRRGFYEIVGNSIETEIVEERRVEPTEEGRPVGETALEKFCVNFTQKAKEGEIDPVFGRDAEIRQMVDILARRRKNNPIVVGEAGVGKTAVVEGLALRIVEGDVPKVLKDVELLSLDMGLLQAGAGMKGEFENRLKSVINEVKASPKPIILFIDEAHTLIGAGGPAGGGDAANLLKPALARGELRTVAATTWSEYKKYFEKDAALARRFQPVKLDEPTTEETVVILRGLKDKYEAAHDVIIRDDAVIACAELSNRYISGRQLPDKAVDLLDTSAARVKINLTTQPDILEDRKRELQSLEREYRALKRDQEDGLEIEEERLESVEKEISRVKEEIKEISNRWLKEKEAVDKILELRERIRELKEKKSTDEDGEKEGEGRSEDKAVESLDEVRKQYDEAVHELQKLQGKDPLIHHEVTTDIVAKVVSDWTGIPVGKMLRDEAASILQLEDNLKARIKGQDHAISTICQIIRSAKAGLTSPNAPLGVFLLVGPSGVGKTETGLSIADLLFGGERFMVTINMSEFQEKHTVSRLIGSPPGYVGYGEGGVLTEAVRQRPYSVVLLDEVEKADPEVMNLFYQVFDKGMLSDGEGRVINFSNTVLFLTSNLASDVITEMCSDGDNVDLEVLSGAIRPILSNHFKPALLARMTVIPYLPLNPEAMKEIVCLKLDKLGERLMESHKISFNYTPAIVDQIAARCTEVETGARNIDHILQGTLLPQISNEILARMGEGKLPSTLNLDLDENGNFSLEFSE